MGETSRLSAGRVFRTWWPLAASWVLMGIEQPAIAATVARLAQPEVNLAAFGGLVYPLTLIIESPVIMLLAASTALSKDMASYRKLWRFMMATGAVMTALHLLLVTTPLYYVVARGVLGLPEAVLGPGRLALLLMLPWTWSIAYRRFNQGVLIRCGHARAVSSGSAIRLTVDGIILVGGYLIGTIPGAAVASAALGAGVLCEACYAGVVVRPVLRDELSLAAPVDPPLTYRTFIVFYVPLVLTSLLSFLALPIGSAALSRMPAALASLAVWSVVIGVVFIFRSLGVAFNEVVVALMDEAGAATRLQSFALGLAGATTAALVLIAATPLADIWFRQVSALDPRLATMARTGIWFTIPLPMLSVLQSWFQGSILYSRRTSGISEAVVIYLVSSAVLLTAGVLWGQATGLYVGLATLTISTALQTGWLWFRSRPAIRANLARGSELEARS